MRLDSCEGCGANASAGSITDDGALLCKLCWGELAESSSVVHIRAQLEAEGVDVAGTVSKVRALVAETLKSSR